MFDEDASLASCLNQAFYLPVYGSPSYYFQARYFEGEFPVVGSGFFDDAGVGFGQVDGVVFDEFVGAHAGSCDGGSAHLGCSDYAYGCPGAIFSY